MTFTIEPKETLIEEIRVTVNPDDYREAYLSTLKNYTRQASLPGFRPGKVPAAVVKKRFGPSILADQLNKLVGQELTGYINDNNIKFVGRPYLANEAFNDLDPEGNASYTFSFEIGREPEFELNIDKLPEVPKYEISLTDADVERTIERYRYQVGATEPAESVDIASGKNFTAIGILNLTDNPVVDERPKFAFPRFFSVQTGLQPELKPLLDGKKVGDVVEMTLPKLYKDDMEAASLLRLEVAEYNDVKDQVMKFEIRQVFEVKLAELDAEFFAKVLPQQEVPADAAAFRIALKAKMEADAAAMADSYLTNQIKNDVLMAHPFELPDRILVRWLYDEFEDFRKEGELQRRYPQYRAELRFHLIRKKLAERFPEVEPQAEDLRKEVADKFMQYMGLNIAAPAEGGEEGNPQQALIDQLVDNVMQDENYVRREFDALASKKFMEVLQNQVLTVKPAKVSYQEFERKVATGSR